MNNHLYIKNPTQTPLKTILNIIPQSFKHFPLLSIRLYRLHKIFYIRYKISNSPPHRKNNKINKPNLILLNFLNFIPNFHHFTNRQIPLLLLPHLIIKLFHYFQRPDSSKIKFHSWISTISRMKHHLHN